MFRQRASLVQIHYTTSTENVNRYFRIAAMLDWRLTSALFHGKIPGWARGCLRSLNAEH